MPGDHLPEDDGELVHGGHVQGRLNQVGDALHL